MPLIKYDALFFIGMLVAAIGFEQMQFDTYEFTDREQQAFEDIFGKQEKDKGEEDESDSE